MGNLLDNTPSTLLGRNPKASLKWPLAHFPRNGCAQSVEAEKVSEEKRLNHPDKAGVSITPSSLRV